ncbi:MAG TPA: ribosome maturation factor RimP [Actinomycetota bacterium]|nr:ribosome maturation factor RimP [Actinomycetota bacterium]
MARPELTDAVRATCEQILAARGVELVTLTLAREPVGQTLRLTVDRPEGTIPLDEIVAISEAVSRALDDADPIPGRYTLEVASAGIERPLVRPADYQRFQGRRVKVKTEEPIEGQRVFQGTLRSAGSESFILEAIEGRRSAGEVVEIPFAAVARTRLVADWDRELKGLGSAPGAGR